MKPVTKIVKILVFLIVIYPFMTSLSVEAKKETNTVGESPSLDATIQAEDQIIEMGSNGIGEGAVLVDFFPSGEAVQNERSPIDVVFVFDKSGSMGERVGNDTKLNLAQQAVKDATDIFFSNKKKGKDKDQFALVPFSSDIYRAPSIDSLKNNPKLVSHEVDKLSANGGTNYTQALARSREILATDRISDKYIIFLTDGIPTNSQKVMSVNGDYNKLYTIQQYSFVYSWGMAMMKVFFGDYSIGPDGEILITGEKENVVGDKVVYFDANPGRNYSYFSHNNNFYQYEEPFMNNISDVIERHGLEQAEALANEDITLNSIGFGSNDDLNMSYLHELSSKTNGKAVQASVNNIDDYFRRISQNLSNEYPSLTEGFLKFKLPANVLIEENEFISKAEEYVLVDLKDIPFTPTPPSLNDPRLHYEIPLKFVEEGTYQFSFDVIYNSGSIQIKGIPVTFEVSGRNVMLEQLKFNNATKTMYVGEKIALDSLFSLIPENATNKEIQTVVSSDNQYVDVSKEIDENGKIKWYIEAFQTGYSTITAIAEAKDKNGNEISDSILILVKDNGEQDDSDDDDNEDNQGNDNGSDLGGTDLRW